MNRVLYSGKVIDDTELRKVNCILQTQANNMWSEVRTYDFLYKSSYNNYLNGYIEYNDSFSEYNSAMSDINTMNLIVNSTRNVEGVQEAQQSAQQSAEQHENDSRSEETENEIIEGLPDDPLPSGIDYNDQDGYPYDVVALEIFKTMDEEEKKAAEESSKALDDLKESIKNDERNAESSSAAAALLNNPQSSAGESQSYVNNATGQTQTVSISDDGKTITVTGVTASDDTVGTVTQNPDGTMTFTTEDGTSIPWTGGTPADIVNSANDYNQEHDSQETKDATAAAEEAQTKYDDLHTKYTDEFNKYAQDVAERMREETPSGNEPGYSESDSSSWSSDDYDPSEWDF